MSPQNDETSAPLLTVLIPCYECDIYRIVDTRRQWVSWDFSMPISAWKPYQRRGRPSILRPRATWRVAGRRQKDCDARWTEKHGRGFFGYKSYVLLGDPLQHRCNGIERGNSRHGVALLCGFDTPSLTAQGGQRLLP